MYDRLDCFNYGNNCVSFKTESNNVLKINTFFSQKEMRITFQETILPLTSFFLFFLLLYNYFAFIT